MEHEPLTPVVESDEAIDISTSQSLVERLREQRKAHAEQRFTDIDIPGFNGELFCRYRLLEGREVDAIGVKVRQEFRTRPERVLAATQDNLIAACEEFWVRDEGREIPIRQVPQYEGPKDLPVRYNEDLASFLAFGQDLPNSPTARSIMLALFGGNDIAVSAHGAMLIRWMMQAGTEVDMDLGEF